MTKTMKTKDEVLILYVNNFKAKGGELELNGHLQKGRIYLCLKHEEDKDPKRTMYRIFFDDQGSLLDGIFIQSLNESNESWDCDLEELDMTKLEKYRLSDNDVNYAIDIKNMTLEEVKKKIDSNLTEEQADKTVFERLDESTNEIAEDMGLDDIERIYNEALDQLSEDREHRKIREYSKNNLKEVLDDVIEYVGTTFDDKYQSAMIDTMEMLNSKEHGKILNVFNAVKYLSRYSTTGFEKSENPQDLMKAIHYILIELNRVKASL